MAKALGIVTVAEGVETEAPGRAPARAQLRPRPGLLLQPPPAAVRHHRAARPDGRTVRVAAARSAPTTTSLESSTAPVVVVADDALSALLRTSRLADRTDRREPARSTGSESGWQTGRVHELPVIDVALGHGRRALPQLVREIDAACRRHGFFYVVGHGVRSGLQRPPRRGCARDFFALPDEREGRRSPWRTAAGPGGAGSRSAASSPRARPDRKEGIYFGAELAATTRGSRRAPLHGPNLFPAHPPELRDAVLDVHRRDDRARPRAAARPRPRPRPRGRLVRPARSPPTRSSCSASSTTRRARRDRRAMGRRRAHRLRAAHDPARRTTTAGSQVRSRDGWIDVAARSRAASSCNIGDMLERMTGGRYRSTPHRVRNAERRRPPVVPVLLRPGWDAEVLPVPDLACRARSPAPDGRRRALGRRGRPHDWTGTYGEYLLSKVGQVFPELRDDVLPEPAP